MDVRAVAGGIRPGLGGERGHEPGTRRDAADRLSHEDLRIRRLQRGAGFDRQLLLRMSELRVVLLELDPLRLQRFHRRVDDVGRGRHADGGEAQTLVDRDVATIDFPSEAELVLDRAAKHHVAVGQAIRHPSQEVPRAGLIRLTGKGHVVDEHRRRVGCVRQQRERGRVGDQADLSGGPHALDGLELIERVHGLHRDREADAGSHPLRQSLDVRGLAPDHAPVVAVQESDEPDSGRPTGSHHFLRGHQLSQGPRPPRSPAGPDLPAMNCSSVFPRRVLCETR